jgi:hypothetical protein
VLWFPDIISCTNTANGNRLIITPEIVTPPDRFGISLEYNSLTEFYNNSSMNLLSDQNGQFNVFDQTALQFISPESISEIIVDDYVRDNIVWETLGRMCHLLADMSVSAHTHKADHFGSNGPGNIGNGNDLIGGNPRVAELEFLNSINLSTFGNPTTSNGPWNVENLQNIRDKTYPFIIRATAGLLFWFAVETMIISKIEDKLSLPTIFYLEQNYPNPFNPTTCIQYAISSKQFVSLNVYDVLGNKIATLVNEEKPAGSYEVEFSSGLIYQTIGGPLPSGVYFYQLKTDGFIETKKMILLR